MRLKKLEQFCKVTVLFISKKSRYCLYRITKRNKTQTQHFDLVASAGPDGNLQTQLEVLRIAEL